MKTACKLRHVPQSIWEWNATRQWDTNHNNYYDRASNKFQHICLTHTIRENKKEPNIIMIISKRSQIKCVQAKTSTTKYLGMECILDNEIPTKTMIMIE